MGQINRNYIYLQTGYAYEEQVVGAFMKTFIRHQVETRFKVSMVKVGGMYCGYAYVWIENKEAFRKLTGIDSDGNRNVRLIPDPNWVKPTIPLKEALEIFEREDIYDPRNWADASEHEDARKEIIQSYQQGIMEVPVDPSYKLPKYEYHSEQEKQVNEDYFDDNNLPEHGAFVVGIANVPKRKIMVQQHVIFCNHVPSWITIHQLKNLFSPYASDTQTLHKKRVNKKISTDTYPFIAITPSTANKGRPRGKKYNNRKNNVVYVTYDEKTIDGRMALLVCRKMVVVDPTNPKRIVTLIFNHPKIKSKCRD